MKLKGKECVGLGIFSMLEEGVFFIPSKIRFPGDIDPKMWKLPENNAASW